MTPTTITKYPTTARGVVFAKDQKQYNELPALRFPDGRVITKWQLTWKEKLQILLGSGVFICLLTFNMPLQPMKVGTTQEDVQ